MDKKEAIDALDEIMKAMSNSKAMDLVGHFNDLFIFIGKVKE